MFRAGPSIQISNWKQTKTPLIFQPVMQIRMMQIVVMAAVYTPLKSFMQDFADLPRSGWPGRRVGLR